MGTPQAHIGIVLDEIWTAPDDYATEFTSGIHHTTLPWGIRQSGFNNTNSLIWNFDFLESSIFETDFSVSSRTPTWLEKLGAVNQSLIANSSLRIIVLCGAKIIKCIGIQNAVPMKLELPIGNFDAYADVEGDFIERIYIHCPISIGSLWNNSLQSNSRISELFRFISLMTCTVNISPYFAQNSSAILRIIRQYEAEKNGQERMTVSTLDPEIRSWLHRKGFVEDEQLRRLESKANSLIHACILLSSILPTCPSEFRSSRKRTVPQSKFKSRESKFPEQRQEIAKLYKEVTGYEPRGDTTQQERQPASLDRPRDNSQPMARQSVQSSLDDEPHQKQPSSHKSYQEQVSQVPHQAQDLDSNVQDLDYMPDLDDINDILMLSQQDDAEIAAFELEKQPLTEVDSTDKIFTWCGDYEWSRAVQTARDVKSQRQLIQGIALKGTLRRERNLRVYLPREIEIGVSLQRISGYEETVVQVELMDHDEQHPDLWATKALPDDPAKRFAFGLTIRFEGQEPEITCYAKNNGEYAPYKANAFVDWMDGLTDERIAELPRRYLNLRDIKVVTEKLVDFNNGCYTDDSGRAIQIRGERYYDAAALSRGRANLSVRFKNFIIFRKMIVLRSNQTPFNI